MIGLAVVIGCSEAANALSYRFGPESIGGGVVDASMRFEVDGPVVRAWVENMSATQLDEGNLNRAGHDGHAPAITGFGFDVGDQAGRLIDWRIRAFDGDGDLVTLAESGVRWGRKWTGAGAVAGIERDVVFKSRYGVRAGLYNPEAEMSVALAGVPNYFTTVELEMIYSADPMLGMDDFNPFIRMQNVGRNGRQSAKLYGEILPGDQAQGPIIPEPGTWATGVLALSMVVTRFRSTRL